MNNQTDRNQRIPSLVTMPRRLFVTLLSLLCSLVRLTTARRNCYTRPREMPWCMPCVDAVVTFAGSDFAF